MILQHAPTKDHKGDFFTKDSFTAAEFDKALASIRVHPNRADFERGERFIRAQSPPVLPSEVAKSLASKLQDSATE